MILELNKVYGLKNQLTEVLVQIVSMEFSITKCATQYVCVPAKILSSGEIVLIPLGMLTEQKKEYEKTRPL